MRSLLFAPAVRPDLVAKLPRSRPGAGVIDLEDGVPKGRKDAARALIAGQIAGLLERDPAFAVCVRVNAPPTPWFAADMAALPAGLAAVVVPKLEHAGQLAQIERALADAGRDGLGVIAGIETARGVLDVRNLLDGPVTAAYFGAEDYVADLGGVRTRHSTEVLYARSRVALACRVAGIRAWTRSSSTSTTTTRSAPTPARAASSGTPASSACTPGRSRSPTRPSSRRPGRSRGRGPCSTRRRPPRARGRESSSSTGPWSTSRCFARPASCSTGPTTRRRRRHRPERSRSRATIAHRACRPSG